MRGRVSPVAYVLTSLVLNNHLYFLDSFHCSSPRLQPIFGRGRGAGRKKPFTQYPALCNTRKVIIAAVAHLLHPSLPWISVAAGNPHTSTLCNALSTLIVEMPKRTKTTKTPGTHCACTYLPQCVLILDYF